MTRLSDALKRAAETAGTPAAARLCRDGECLSGNVAQACGAAMSLAGAFFLIG